MAKFVFLVVALIILSNFSIERAEAGGAVCPNCPGRYVECPRGCFETCRVRCGQCKADCGRCNKPGAICMDPRFMGGDGVMFYFHGKKDADFCIVSDSNLHINAHFIGKTRPNSPSATRHFTWIQAVGVMYDDHKLYVGARKVIGAWDAAVDNLEVAIDGEPISLPAKNGASMQYGSLRVSRLSNTNQVTIQVMGVFSLNATVVPVTAEESRVHNYGIDPQGDCFAHIDLNFDFYNLSPAVHGVLGQTYSAGFISPVDQSLPMPIMGGEPKFISSSLMATDCAASKFGSLPPQSGGILQFPVMKCGTGNGGVTCKR